MIVTKEGVYKSVNGNLYEVFNVMPAGLPPYFRAYHRGGYFNVNQEKDELPPFDEVELEMTEYIGPIQKN